MNKLLSELKHNYDFKQLSQNISIHDNKQPSKPFGDRYHNFLLINKGVKIESKDDLIKLLNKKPRSFLSRLQGLVRQFKNSHDVLMKHVSSKKQHPKNIIANTKIKRAIYSPITLINKLTNNIVEDKHLKSMSQVSKIISPHNYKQNISTLDKQTNILYDSKLNIPSLLINKINTVKQILDNNNIKFPLYFLNPLLKKNLISKKPTAPNLKNTNLYTLGVNKSLIVDNNLVNKNKKVLLNTTNFIDLNLKLTSILTETLLTWPYVIKINNTPNKYLNKLEQYKQIKIQQVQIAYINKINYFKDILARYYKNNTFSNNVTITKYFQLITPYKHVKPFHQNINYYFNKYNNKQKQQIFNLLQYAFRAMSCLISKPIFMETNDNIKINLFYFFIPGKVKRLKKNSRLWRLRQSKLKHKSIPIVKSLNGMQIKNKQLILEDRIKMKSKKKHTGPFKKLNKFITEKNFIKLNKLCTILSRIFNKPVQIELIPLTVPFFDDNILVKIIGILSTKVSVRTIFNFIYRNTKLYSKITANYKYRYSVTRSFIAGIKIKIGGRLMTQRVIPKKSSRVMQRGATSVGKVTYVDWSRINLKNRRGAHSITVKMSHVI